MSIRGRAKPSKNTSLLGAIVDVLLLIFGLSSFSLNLPPQFNVFFVRVVVVMTIASFHIYNVLGKDGASLYEGDVKLDEKTPISADGLDASLCKLAKLKEDGLIGDEEFKKKRDEPVTFQHWAESLLTTVLLRNIVYLAMFKPIVVIVVQSIKYFRVIIQLLCMHLYTIGHSTRKLEELVAHLKEHGIQVLVDVRAWPTSRRNPQFNRESLGRILFEEGIRYEWLGDSLGGYRRKGWGKNRLTRLGEAKDSGTTRTTP